MPAIDGTPIVPITSGLGSTGDIYAELGVNASGQHQWHRNRNRRVGDETRSYGADSERQRAFCFD